jgi:nitrate reductase gamma subunit
MYDFLIGPMLALSLIIFIGGMAYRIRQFFKLSEALDVPPSETLSKELIQAVENRETDEYIRIHSAMDILLKWRLKLRRTLPGRAPIFSAVTIVFHVLLILLPLVTVGHNILLDTYFGVNLPTLSETTVDALTQLVIFLVVFFLLRRMFVAKVRAVTGFRDLFALVVTAAPFVTGYMAYHHIGPYQWILYLHILFGELMLIAIPFSKLAHMPFFILGRFLVRNELTLGGGARRWVNQT